MQLTENEREYLKLIGEARKDGSWCPPEMARRFLDEEDLREAGIDEKYIKRPDKFDYSDDESNNKSIDEKVEEIPERVEKLIRDVELLYAAGYLDVDWDECWSEFLPDQETDEDTPLPLSTQYGFEEPHKELGNRLGGMVTSLALRSQTKLNTEFYREIAEGFIYAISYGMGGGERVEFYSDLAEKMEESEEHASRFLEPPSERIPEWRSELKEEIQSCVEARLRQEGYETPDEFVRTVRTTLTGEYNREGYLGIWDAIADDENPAKKEEWNVEEHITRDIVRGTVKENDLYISYLIKNQIQEDLGELVSISQGGITAGEILVTVPQEGEKVGEVAQDVSNHTGKQKSKTTPAVAKLSRFMSCEKDRQLGVWEGNKILSLDQEGENMTDWVVEPTEYGRLLKSNVTLRRVKSAKNRESIFTRYRVIDVPDEILEDAEEKFL